MTAYKKIPILFERRIGIFLISNTPLWDEIKSNPLSEESPKIRIYADLSRILCIII